MAKHTRENPQPTPITGATKSDDALVFSSMDALAVLPTAASTPADEPAQQTIQTVKATPSVAASLSSPTEHLLSNTSVPMAEQLLYWPWYCTFFGLAFIYRSWSNCLPGQHMARRALNDAMGIGS